MKKLGYLLALICVMSLTGCIFSGGDEPIPDPGYTAVIMSRAEFEGAVQLLSPRPVENSGKIYIKQEFLFVNDVNKGFHIYLYADPQNPVPIGFLQIPGATDLAVRGDILYINQAVDLVAIQYNSVANTIEVTKRNKNIFPPKNSPDWSTAESNENEIITDWIPIN